MGEVAKRKTRWVEWLALIVLVSIAVAMFAAVGGSRPDPRRRATLAELKILDGLMRDYISAGHPEPVPASPWIYGGGRVAVPPEYAETLPASDPVEWVAAFRKVPGISKKMDSFPLGTDEGVPKRGGGSANQVVLDEYGTPVRYVPSDPKTGREGYFMSAGSDGKFSNMVGAPAAMRADEIYSTDPQ